MKLIDHLLAVLGKGRSHSGQGTSIYALHRSRHQLTANFFLTTENSKLFRMENMNGGFTSVNPTALISQPTNPPTSTAGTKRKRDTKSNALKFYAVRVGKEPGIYHSWSECLDQVRGFPKAAFKSFTSLTEAEAFLNNEDGGKMGGAGSGKFYGVREGRVPGVYTSWPEVLEQITGWKGPKHKVFKTRAEAELFVNEGKQDTQNGVSMPVNGDGAIDTIEVADSSTQAKKAKTGKGSKKGIKEEGSPDGVLETGGEYSPGSGPLPDGAEDNFDPTITLDQTLGTARYKTASELARTKYQASGPAPEAPVRIYTDGSALSNGMNTSMGGVGVYFGPKDRRNVSEPLTGTKQTNQRAELTAILRALEVAPRDRKIVIVSDSYYAIRCVCEWFQKWRSNHWHNSTGKPVENRDLIQKVLDMLEERMRLNRHRMDPEDDVPNGVDNGVSGDIQQPWNKGPGGVTFSWVKGHAKDEGNNAADELAVNGARAAQELGEDVVLD